jgi:hypothetical protein
VNTVKQRFLPSVPEAYDGIDHFVLASNRIADDVAGRRALRLWLERGGSLWVMLDRVESATVASLLGDELDFQVVDRVSLTRVQIGSGPANPHRTEDPASEFEEPVDFVRVLVSGKQILYTVNGWPAAFQIGFGRGRVLFTTLGARGWMRPRTVRDPRPPFRDYPHLPVALTPFEFLATELHPRHEGPALTADELRSYVTDQISYRVVTRNKVLLVFGLFFLILAIASVAFAKKAWLEHLGWLGPALALVAAGVFVGIGERSRGAVPPTVAVAQIVDAIPGQDEVDMTGYLGVYQPAPSTSTIGAQQGGDFELDLAGLEGRVVRRVQTDIDRWHLENLELPAGVRLAPFRHTVRTSKPVEATVRFGPEGVEGRLHAGPFCQLEDVLLSTPGAHTVTVRLAPDGSFQATSADELYAGQVIDTGLLSDRQRARQILYKKFLAEPQPRSISDRSLLLAWAEPLDMGFSLVPSARVTGSALLTVPLQFERVPRGSPVTVPGAFVDCRRIANDGRPLPPAVESHLAATVRLRFQIPHSVWPLVIESARLTVKVHAPAREVIVSTFADEQSVPLRRLKSPVGVEQVEILEPRLLRTGAQGILYMTIAMGEIQGGDSQDPWRIENVGLEVRGKTSEEERSEHKAQ